MKVAFHFDAHHDELGCNYGAEAEKRLFNILLSRRNLNLTSKVLTGDLLLCTMAYEVETVSATGQTSKFNPDLYQKIVDHWLRPLNTIWYSMISDRLERALKGTIYVVCLEKVEMKMAEYIDEKLKISSNSYVGGLEVDDSSPMHWQLYSNFISPSYRVTNMNASIFWDGISEEAPDEFRVQRFKDIGFKKVGIESLNGRYTIFDEYHDFDHARRVAEWKKTCGGLLAFIADDVAHSLGDAIPDLGDKLWSALTTFNEAETTEQFAQVTASCRRIVEYVSDQLFPPVEGEVDGRKLGTKHYRNRLLAFSDEARRSDTNIDLILVSTKTLSDQMEKLANLANKGVHAEVYRSETRRCLLRTIMLLDDICSLKAGAFEVKTKLNFDDFYDSMYSDT
jgi:hypothetical protein